MEKTILSNRFKTFAIDECKGSSPLYELLSLEISEDDELLELCSYVKEGQPVPNLLFGAVHFLLLQGTDHELKYFYGSMIDTPRDETDCFSYFKDYCRKNKHDIISILKEKSVQTNEVRRCSYLYPVFCYVYEKAKKPLALIEIGTSAGLQLMWDKYSYSYGTEVLNGHPESEVHIKAELKDGCLPPLMSTSPPVASRTGLDLHVNDLNNPGDYLWLKALIWPNHSNRRELFESAANYVAESQLALIEGDGVELLPNIAKETPEDAVICVFHTHVANQLPIESKRKLLDNIKQIGENRDIFHVYNNIQDRDLHLDYYIDGYKYENTVGESDGHGKWFSWNLS